jgi:hypothetical protein
MVHCNTLNNLKRLANFACSKSLLNFKKNDIPFKSPRIYIHADIHENFVNV